MSNPFSKTIFLVFLFLFTAFFLVLPINAQSLKSDMRIVSLSPHITEIIFRLKADHLLVGRTDFCHFPSAASKIDKVGGYLNIDYEKIVALQPDIVFSFPMRKIDGS